MKIAFVIVYQTSFWTSIWVVVVGVNALYVGDLLVRDGLWGFKIIDHW